MPLRVYCFFGFAVSKTLLGYAVANGDAGEGLPLAREAYTAFRTHKTLMPSIVPQSIFCARAPNPLCPTICDQAPFPQYPLLPTICDQPPPMGPPTPMLLQALRRWPSSLWRRASARAAPPPPPPVRRTRTSPNASPRSRRASPRWR